MPTISVLMPAYNSAKYIADAINSVLNQTFTDFELIIINDGSTDNTHQVISSFSDTRIKYFQNNENEGLTLVRNKLISLASCNYIAFLDSDDIANENRLEIEYNAFVYNTNIGLVSSSAASLTEDGKVEKQNWYFNLNEVELKIQLLFINPIVTSTVMFKKQILPKEIFRNGYPPCEDYDLWVRMLLNSKGIVLPDFLATYRLYQNSVSKRKADDAKDNRNKVITDQLEYYFPNHYSKEESQLHLSLVEFSIKNTTDDLIPLKQWIKRLITLNTQFNHFDEQILKQVLYERMLKKMLRLQNYSYPVFRILMQLKKELQPVLTFEMRKKEIAVFAFSIARKKIIAL